MIEYKQMDKADRDKTHAMHAEEECRQLLTQFPNSKFAPQGQQLLRNIQEVLADAEFRVGGFYHTKGVFYSAANRLQGLTDHYPLYSRADEALWQLADSYAHMGKRFRDKSAAAYAEIVRNYPLSPYAQAAKKKLIEMEKPVPEPDPVALARQKYELDNREKIGMVSHFWGIFTSHPDVRMAAKSGAPPMEGFHPTIPVTVTPSAAAATTTEVSGTLISGPSALDTQPDARQKPSQNANDASNQTQQNDPNPSGQPATRKDTK